LSAPPLSAVHAFLFLHPRSSLCRPLLSIRLRRVSLRNRPGKRQKPRRRHVHRRIFSLSSALALRSAAGLDRTDGRDFFIRFAVFSPPAKILRLRRLGGPFSLRQAISSSSRARDAPFLSLQRPTLASRGRHLRGDFSSVSHRLSQRSLPEPRCFSHRSAISRGVLKPRQLSLQNLFLEIAGRVSICGLGFSSVHRGKKKKSVPFRALRLSCLFSLLLVEQAGLLELLLFCTIADGVNARTTSHAGREKRISCRAFVSPPIFCRALLFPS